MINAETAHMLLERVKSMTPVHKGIDRQAYLFDDYAVLSTSRLKLRNVDVRDDDLRHFDDLIDRLIALWKTGVNVVLILGHCYDPESADGEGFQFIDLDSHADNYFGLTDDVVSVKAWSAVGGFVPCHFGAGTKAFAPMALDSEAIHEIGETGLEQLASNNLRVFGKCLNAMKANSIPDNMIRGPLQRITVFGQRSGEENKN